jgi:Leucine-rich repeat (LRR) protein
MEEFSEIVKESKKKPVQRKYIIIAGLFLLALITSLDFIYITQPDPQLNYASEKVIRQIVASQLEKEPDDLTDEDFANITELRTLIWPKAELKGAGQAPIPVLDLELPNIKMLEKFTNLQKLSLSFIHYPESAIPKWIKIFAKYGIRDIKKRYALDLSPIEQLSNLQTLSIQSTTIKNIKPLSKLTNLKQLSFLQIEISNLEPIKNLTNLQELSIGLVPVSDLEPIKRLINLQTLQIGSTQVSDLEPIKGLTRLQQLNINYTQVSNLEPIKGLINLERLQIADTPINNLEPLKSLKKLKSLYLPDCNNITDEQIEDLQKALPELEVGGRK